MAVVPSNSLAIRLGAVARAGDLAEASSMGTQTASGDMGQKEEGVKLASMTKPSNDIDHTNTCLIPISHAQRLPPELAAEIFLECCSEIWDEMRFIVCQVCSAWRQIAISTPNYGPEFFFILFGSDWKARCHSYEHVANEQAHSR
jgi:hypothetical protein